MNLTSSLLEISSRYPSNAAISSQWRSLGLRAFIALDSSSSPFERWVACSREISVSHDSDVVSKVDIMFFLDGIKTTTGLFSSVPACALNADKASLATDIIPDLTCSYPCIWISRGTGREFGCKLKSERDELVAPIHSPRSLPKEIDAESATILICLSVWEAMYPFQS